MLTGPQGVGRIAPSGYLPGASGIQWPRGRPASASVGRIEKHIHITGESPCPRERNDADTGPQERPNEASLRRGGTEKDENYTRTKLGTTE